jgi:hypothetical protein
LDATRGRVDGSAGNMWFHSQSQWKREKSIEAEFVSFRIDFFDFEGEVQGAAKDFSCKFENAAEIAAT